MLVAVLVTTSSLLLLGCTTQRSAVDSYNQRLDDCQGAGNTPFDCRDWIRN